MATASFMNLYNTSQTIGSEYRFSIYSYDATHLHKVVLKCGSYTKTWDRIKGGVETTYTVPLEWAKAMPNATSMNGTLTLTTYQSNYSTKVGSNVVKDIKFSIPTSMKPTVSLNLEETVDGIAEQFGAYVQGKSKIKVTVNANGAYGSTIKKYNTTINDVTYTSSSFTTGYIKATSTSFSQDKACSVTVTDSRGRTGVGSEVFTVYTYSKPKINTFTVARCLADGTLNDEGTCVKVVSNATINDVNEKNAKAFKLSYKLTTESDWTEIELSNASYQLINERIISGFDINSTYNFKIEVTDFFETVSKIINVGTSDNIMDFLANGKGMAIGKAAEFDEVLDVGYPTTYLSKHTHIGGYRTSDDEKNIYFNNTGNGEYYHNSKIYGGSGSSIVGLGIWDYINNHIVIHYEEDTETIRLNGAVKLAGFKDIATVIGNTDVTLTTTDVTEMPMKSSVTLGSKLTVLNGQVIIGAGVNYVKIEGSIYAHSGFEANDMIHVNILKNTTTVYTALRRCVSTYETVTGAAKIIGVAEGDVIKLCVRNQTAGRGLIGGNGNATYMTVEVVG